MSKKDDWGDEGNEEWGDEGDGSDPWGKDGAASGVNDGSAMEETPSEEAQMQNLLFEAEEEEKERPTKALPLFEKYLGLVEERIKKLESDGEGNGSVALDLKSARRKAVCSLVVLNVGQGQVDKAVGHFNKLMTEISDAKLQDPDCLVIYRLLNDVQAACKAENYKKIEALYETVIKNVPVPTKMLEYKLAEKAPKKEMKSDKDKPESMDTSKETKTDDSSSSSDKSSQPPAKKQKTDKGAKATKDGNEKDSSSTETKEKAGDKKEGKDDDEEAEPEDQKPGESEYKAPDLKDTLWFGMNAELAKLYTRQKNWKAVTAKLAEMGKAFPNAQQQITLLAIELQMAVDSGDAKAVTKVLDKADEVVGDEKKDRKLQVSLVDAKSLAVIRRELALRDLKAEKFTDAFRKFSKAYLGFHQVSFEEGAVVCLKGALLTQMLTRRKSVFYSHKFKAYAKHKDVKSITALAEAFDLQVGYKYTKELTALKPTLSKDPMIAPYLPLLEALTPAIDPTDTEDIRAIYRQVDLDACKGMECAVCLDEFGEGPHRRDMHDHPAADYAGKIIFPRGVRLFRCDGHYFHRHCVMDWMGKHNTCPVCGTYYGKAIGTQPDGKMTVKKLNSKLPGNPSCGTIQIDFEFPQGTQGENHPHPGSPFSASRKTAYLPDNAEGQNILKLFELAWERKILFKVDDKKDDHGGTPSVVENGISFKTVNKESSSVHAYPDPNYLEIAREQLQRKGVFLQGS